MNTPDLSNILRLQSKILPPVWCGKVPLSLYNMSPTKSQKAAAAKLAQYRRQEGEEDDGAERETGERGM